MPRLPKGIYKRTYCTKHGAKVRFYGAVWDPRSHKLRTTSICPTAAEARRLHDKLVDKLKRGELAPKTGDTVGDLVVAYCDYLQRRVRLGRIKQSTYETTSSVVRSTLSQYGNLPISDVTTNLIDNLIDTLLDNHAQNYVREAMMKVRQAFDYAAKQRMIYVNPAAAVELPDRTSTRTLQPPLDHVEIILQETDNRGRAIVGLAALAGLRRGEIFGLRPDHIETDRIHIVQQYYAGRVTSPKSRKSIRDVPILPELAEYLSAWIAEGASVLWVFPGRVGRPLNSRSWSESALYPLLDRLELPRYTLHSFRHFFSTYMHDLGFKTRDIMRIMGHADLKMTLDYDGEFSNTIDRIAKQMRDLPKNTNFPNQENMAK
jgi:integrase